MKEKCASIASEKEEKGVMEMVRLLSLRNC